VAIRGGEDVKMAVDDVGTGVGYVTSSSRASRFRFGGRGSVGDEENGSKAGSKDAVGRLLPASGGPSVAWCIDVGAIVLLRKTEKSHAHDLLRLVPDKDGKVVYHKGSDLTRDKPLEAGAQWLSNRHDNQI
jgi:hypothetical protein